MNKRRWGTGGSLTWYFVKAGDGILFVEEYEKSIKVVPARPRGSIVGKLWSNAPVLSSNKKFPGHCEGTVYGPTEDAWVGSLILHGEDRVNVLGK